MAFNFPDNPTVGQEYQPDGGPLWIYDGLVWNLDTREPLPEGCIGEAPIDGQQYGREDANWTVITGGGGDPVAWTDITGKPNTFPPDAHTHAQAEITGLVTALADKEPTIAVGIAAQYWTGIKTWATLDKAAVGLSNVDNTADSAKPVSTAQAAANALKVTKAGDVMTGDLGISKTLPAINIDKAASGDKGSINFRTGVNMRWEVSSNTAAEGANTGSNFHIGRYNDAGTLLDTPISVSRSTGITTLSSMTSVGQVTAYNATAVPAGGTAAIGFKFSSTANFGIFFGSGVPTLSAAKGSHYLRSDGAVGSYTYVNTDGTTTWAPLLDSGAGVLKTGDTMTGSLTVAPPSGASTLTVSSASGAGYSALDLSKGSAADLSFVQGSRAGVPRWRMYIGENTAEAGANAGSNFLLQGFNDAGSALVNPIFITRSNGIVGLPHGSTTTTQAAGDNSTNVATTAFVAAADALNVRKAGDTMTGLNIGTTDNSSAGNGLNLFKKTAGASESILFSDGAGGYRGNIYMASSGSLNFRVGDNTTDDVSIGTTGNFLTAGNAQIYFATAVPAGGVAGAGLKMSSVSNFGIFFGSGAPTLSAAKGSLYLRSDGTSNVTRMYVNTDGAATWTAVNTVA